MPKTYTPKPCRHCGGPKGITPNGRRRGWYCETCSNNRWIEYDLQVRLCDSTARDHHRWDCLDCQRIKRRRMKEAAARGVKTRAKAYPHMRKPVDAETFWQRKAIATVASAKKLGFLPGLDGSIACADCGKPANQYDHRDYGRPLDVEPVCGSCNRKRGTAIWPKPKTFALVPTPAPEASRVA